jgi:hypothetical protein
MEKAFKDYLSLSYELLGSDRFPTLSKSYHILISNAVKKLLPVDKGGE